MKRLYWTHVALLVCIFLPFFTPIALAGNTGPTAAEYGVILNLSGKQRMLIQKMSKEIMLIALGHDVTHNLQNLSHTANLFYKILKGLRDGNPELHLKPTTNKRVRKQLDIFIAKEWMEFSQLIQNVVANKKVTKEQVAFLSEKNLTLLNRLNKCVRLFEIDAGKAGMKSNPGLAATINLSGKQRMLTQKMSKEFLLIAFDFQMEVNKQNLSETSDLFDRTLKGLIAGDDGLGLPGTTNAAIRKQLEVVTELWDGFRPIVVTVFNQETTAVPKARIGEIADLNLPLLKEMDKAVGMYEKEAAK